MPLSVYLFISHTALSFALWLMEYESDSPGIALCIYDDQKGHCSFFFCHIRKHGTRRMWVPMRLLDIVRFVLLSFFLVEEFTKKNILYTIKTNLGILFYNPIETQSPPVPKTLIRIRKMECETLHVWVYFSRMASLRGPR